jgi:hypothetical protein
LRKDSFERPLHLSPDLKKEFSGFPESVCKTNRSPKEAKKAKLVTPNKRKFAGEDYDTEDEAKILEGRIRMEQMQMP